MPMNNMKYSDQEEYESDMKVFADYQKEKSEDKVKTYSHEEAWKAIDLQQVSISFYLPSCDGLFTERNPGIIEV